MWLARQIRHQGSCLLILGRNFFEIPPPVFALATMYWVFCLGLYQNDWSFGDEDEDDEEEEEDTKAVF